MGAKLQRILIVACTASAVSCTALLGLSDKNFDGSSSGLGGSGGASSSATTTSSTGGGSPSASSGGGSGGASSSSVTNATSVSATSASSTSTGGPDAGPVTEIYNGSIPPASLALDASNVYFTTANFTQSPGEVRIAAKDLMFSGVLADNQSDPTAIAVDATDVYWMTTSGGQSAIHKTPKGAGQIVTLMGPPADTIGDVSLYQGNLYFTTGTNNTLEVLPVTGAASSTSLVTGQIAPTLLVADAQGLAWLNLGAAPPPTNHASVTVADLGGQMPTLVAGMQSYPLAIRTDAKRVYWATLDGSVWSVDRNGGNLNQNFSSGGPPVNDLDVDATDIYFTHASQILKVPIGTKNVSTVYTDPSGDTLQRIRIDATDIFFTTVTIGNGRLLKIPK